MHWLQKLCDPDAHNGICKRIYACEFGGEQWSWATNGRLIVFVRGIVEGAAGPKDCKPKSLEKTQEIFTVPEGAQPCDLAALKAFAGRAEWLGPLEECPECQGLSRDSCYVSCTFCEDQGESQSIPKLRPGFIGSTPLNRNFLAQALVFVDGSHVELSIAPMEKGSSFSYIRVVGKGWRACMVSVDAKVNWKDAPRFQLTPEKAQV